MNTKSCTGQHNMHTQEEPLTSYANKAATSVLIVDDSPLVVKKLIELLEDIESLTSIESCGTYTMAIDLISICSPETILLDINLSDKSGVILLKYIKTFYPEITVIIVTNQSDECYK